MILKIVCSYNNIIMRAVTEAMSSAIVINNVLRVQEISSVYIV